MKNITLAIDEKTLDEVRVYAAKRQTTVNGLVRDYLKGLAAQEDRTARARRRLLELMENSTARLDPDYVWNREEIYAERMLPRHEHLDLRGSGADRHAGKVSGRRKASRP